jgi:hypothetical protein
MESVVSGLAKLGFAKLNAPPSAAMKRDALVSPGRHFGMFTDRRVTEGSIEHQVSLMTRRAASEGRGLDRARQTVFAIAKAEAEGG